jgi:acetyltransferase-like isoleucine patch superfamily enzyme
MFENVFIHHSAEVSEDAEVGEFTKIWNNAQVRNGVKIGHNCKLGKDVYVDENVIIGNFVKIQNGVSVFDGVVISSNVFNGPNVVFTNDKFPRAFIDDWEKRPTQIMYGASIGGNATIVCGNTIGEYSLVGAASVITKNVPKHSLVVGNPAKIVGFVCKCANKLSEFTVHENNIESICQKCDQTVIIDTVAYELFLKEKLDLSDYHY